MKAGNGLRFQMELDLPIGQKVNWEKAAKEVGQSLEQFVLDTVETRAQRVLAQRAAREDTFKGPDWKPSQRKAKAKK